MRSFYTWKFLHREVFTQRNFHTQTLLHTEIFTRRIFTDKGLYTEALLHTVGRLKIANLHKFLPCEKGASEVSKSQCSLSFSRSTLISCEKATPSHPKVAFCRTFVGPTRTIPAEGCATHDLRRGSRFANRFFCCPCCFKRQFRRT